MPSNKNLQFRLKNSGFMVDFVMDKEEY